jgi:hypothetical protein
MEDRKTKVVRVNQRYADAAKILADTSEPKSSQSAVLNHVLKLGGIENIIKKINRVKR